MLPKEHLITTVLFECAFQHGQKRIIEAESMDHTSEPNWVVFRRDGRIIERVARQSLKDLPAEHVPRRREY
jgi:hypothetical protein